MRFYYSFRKYNYQQQTMLIFLEDKQDEAESDWAIVLNAI